MAPPRGTRWPIEPHTQAKHAILRRYLEAWLPIMARWNGRIHYFDGFAGPGRYSGGEEGSPIIALRTLLSHRQFRQSKFRGEFFFTFVELDPDRYAALIEELKHIEPNDRIKVIPANEEFASVVNRILDRLEQRGTRLAPTFAFIDPFGFAGVPMSVVARIMSNQRCECLITFMFEAVNRFLAHPDEKIQRHFDELFGTPGWRAVLQSPAAERREVLVDLYGQQLRQQAKVTFVRTFEMIDSGNRTEYFLYFATNNVDGLSKMKQAMWRADPEGGQTFSDRTDRSQMVLFESGPDLTVLKRSRAERFRDRGSVSIADIERFVLIETPFSEAIHLKRRTLAPMEQASVIQVTRPPGSRNRPGEYPAGTMIRFS